MLRRRLDGDRIFLQMIEGIAYVYRSSGYDYALANDGAPAVPASDVPAAEGGPAIRPATAADAEALAGIDKGLTAGPALFCPRDAGVWRYEITGRRPEDIARREVAVVTGGSGVRGYLVYRGGETPIVVAAAVADPADWPETAAAMYAYLVADGTARTVRPLLPPDHPLVRFGPAGVPRRPRGWYVRTGDAPGLLARLQPLLRARWEGLRRPGSALLIDLYGKSARLDFTGGVLTAVHEVPRGGRPDAAVPPGALLQLALGHRTLPEVLATWPDCELRDRGTEQFLTAAFPRVPVHVWPRN